MQDWLSYRLSDLILFSPQTYYRMFSQYHALVWPGQIAVVASALAISWLVWRNDRMRVAVIVAATWWVLVAAVFHANRYATINWAAKYFALLFIAQAVVLLRTAWKGAGSPRIRGGFHQVVAVILFTCALIAPLISRFAGRQWHEVELVGVTPDPTAIATLALAVVSPVRRWLLAAIPLVWCAVGAATLWALHSPEAWLPIACVALSIAGLVVRVK